MASLVRGLRWSAAAYWRRAGVVRWWSAPAGQKEGIVRKEVGEKAVEEVTPDELVCFN